MLLGKDVLLGKGVPLLEYTLEHMETDEIKQTLQRMLQNGALNPEAIIAEASEKYVLAVETRAQQIKRLEEEVQTFLACVQPLSLFWTANRQLDTLAYIENITDAILR